MYSAVCAPGRIPDPLVNQLKLGGRMILPVGDRLAGQDLWLLEKDENGVHQRSILPVRFVPMTGLAAGS